MCLQTSVDASTRYFLSQAAGSFSKHIILIYIKLQATPRGGKYNIIIIECPGLYVFVAILEQFTLVWVFDLVRIPFWSKWIQPTTTFTTPTSAVSPRPGLEVLWLLHHSCCPQQAAWIQEHWHQTLPPDDEEDVGPVSLVVSGDRHCQAPWIWLLSYSGCQSIYRFLVEWY